MLFSSLKVLIKRQTSMKNKQDVLGSELYKTPWRENPIKVNFQCVGIPIRQAVLS